MRISFSVRQIVRHKSLCLAVLLILAALLGVYHILRTVVIAEDGVFYIRLAQSLPGGYQNVCRKISPGFPLLLYGAHSVFCPHSTTNASWIYSSQVAVLLTQLGALVFLWKIGCCLFRPVWTFGGLLILVVLPISKHGCDVLRDWPHLLFLSAAFYTILRNLKKQSLTGWTMAAFLGGIGYLFRPESLQILLYLLIILAGGFWNPKMWSYVGRFLLAVGLIAAAWLLAVLPYWLCSDSLLPTKLPPMIQSITPDFVSLFGKSPAKESFASAGLDFVQDMTENFLYILCPFWFIGLQHFVIKKIRSKNPSGMMALIFLCANILILLSLYRGWGYICRRHFLPFLSLSCPFVPLGIWLFSHWLHHQFRIFASIKIRCLFINFFTIAALIPIPQVSRPLHYDKEIYLRAAEWISRHIHPAASLVSDDHRIPFYAERCFVFSRKEADYEIVIFRSNNPPAPSSNSELLQKWKDSKITIQLYQMPTCSK